MKLLIRNLIAGLVGLLVLCGIATAFTVSIRPPWWLVRGAGRLWGRTVFAILGVKLRVDHQDRLDSPGPKVVMLNHTSTLDILLIGALLPNGATLIAKRQLMWIPVFNVTLWAARFHFIDREKRRKSVEQMRRITESIRRDERSIVIAPEGTRSTSGELAPFKMGGFHLAAATKHPILPMVVTGAHKLMPKGSYLCRPGDLWVRFLPLIPSDRPDVQNLHAMREYVHKVMKDGLADLRRERG